MGEEFSVYEKWIIVIGKAYVAVFEIKTGKMVFIDYLPGMRLVQGSRKPLLHNNKSLYMFDFRCLESDNSQEYGMYDQIHDERCDENQDYNDYKDMNENLNDAIIDHNKVVPVMINERLDNNAIIDNNKEISVNIKSSAFAYKRAQNRSIYGFKTRISSIHKSICENRSFNNFVEIIKKL